MGAHLNSSEVGKMSLNLKGLLFTKYLWGGYFIFLLSLATVLIYSAWYVRDQLVTSAAVESHSIAVALDELNRRHIQTMSIPLEYMSYQLQQRDGVEHFSPDELQRFFKYVQTAMPSTRVRDLFVVDKDDDVVTSVTGAAEQFRRRKTRAVGEFEYVKMQKNAIVLSSVISPVDHRPLLVLMKSLYTPRGHFAGIVGVTRDFDDFEKFYRSLDVHFPVTFATLRDDGKILYNYPAESAGQVSGLKLPTDLLKNTGGAVNSLGENGPDSFGSFYKFPSSYGSTIYVGYDENAVFATWRHVMKIGASLFFAFMAALAILVKISHRRQRAVERVVENHRLRDNIIRQIQRPTEMLTGTEFLRELVTQLARAFKVNNAVVGLLLPEHTDAVKCVVHLVNGEFVPEQIYKLRETPFCGLHPGESFAHVKSTSLIYPDDAILGHGQIESSMGVVLQNSKGEAIGVLMVYSEAEMSELHFKRSILAVFAARVGAELDRVHTDELRREVDVLRKQIEDRSLQSQKMEAIGSLAEGVAHDFNNILAIILASTEKMLNLHKESVQDQHYLDSIKKACHRARHLVSQILVFSQKDEAEVVPSLLKKIVCDTVADLKTVLPDNVQTTVSIGECGEMEINADVNQLQQAFMNICVNASKAIGPQGGEIRISLQKNRIRDKMYIKCIVHHGGDELGREEIEKVFNPFYAQNISMVVVQRIITNHQGFIEVKSEVGQGTDYEIFLPVLESTAHPEASKIIHLKTEKRVLIVDDEPEIGLLIKELLEIEGLQVDAETDPLAALAQFRADPRRYFIIISDLAMPEMSGFEFCRHVRRVHPQIPLILWSGYYQYLDEDMQDLNIKVLTKPVDVQKLLQMINAEVSQQSLQGTAKEVVGLGSGPSALT
jgi:signal transduction histidine kinase/ActR/RegA family two-component response regulator